jgi:hypothetical protein
MPTKTIQIAFDAQTKSITCPSRIELADGEDVQWALTGATDFYVQFVEVPIRRGGVPGPWPFTGGDRAAFRGEGKRSSGGSAQASPAAAWSTQVTNPTKHPRVMKCTIFVNDGTGLYALDPNVLIDPM